MKTLLSRNVNAVWAVVDQIVVSACTFLVSLVVARMVSVEAFSAFGLSVTVTLFVSAMHRSWLTQPFSVLGVRESEAALMQRFQSVLLLHVWAWPVVALAVVLIGRRYFPGPWFTFAVFAYILAYLLQEAVRRLCFTTARIRLALGMDLMAYGGYLLSLLALGAVTDINVEQALLVGAACFLLSFLWGALRCGLPVHRGPWPHGVDLRAVAWEHWQNSKWVCASQVFMFGSTMLVPFQIAELGSLAWVAHYNAANTIINVLNILRQTMGNYLPIFASRVYHDRGLTAFVQMLDRLAMAVLAASAVLVLLLLVLGEFVVTLLYGVRYLPTAQILPMAAIGPLVAMLQFVTQAGGLALGKTEHIFFSYVAGTVCALALAPLLIPRFGLAGAIWVANAGYIVPTVWHWLAFKRDCRNMTRLEGQAA